jgi:hypothetical protein
VSPKSSSGYRELTAEEEVRKVGESVEKSEGKNFPFFLSKKNPEKREKNRCE